MTEAELIEGLASLSGCPYTEGDSEEENPVGPSPSSFLEEGIPEVISAEYFTEELLGFGY